MIAFILTKKSDQLFLQYFHLHLLLLNGSAVRTLLGTLLGTLLDKSLSRRRLLLGRIPVKELISFLFFLFVLFGRGTQT